jgi:putative holliday junction resolvase
MPRSLGLDVGERRIGIAISDESKLLARPLEVLDRTQKNPFKRIPSLAAEWGADEIVIGQPIEERGGLGPQAARVAEFADKLRAACALPLRFQDERWSSSEAGEVAKINTPRKRAAQPAPDDALAAAVILQRYLDETRQTAD